MIVLKNFLKSFKYAFEGIWYCIKTQRNFRFHTAAAFTAFLLADNYNLDGTQKLVLLFTIVFVLISEMLNTSLEAVVDMTANGYNAFAKIAKDVCAAAVLISAITASYTGIVLFYDNGNFWNVLLDYIKNPLFWVYAALCIIYISGVFFKNGGKNSEQ